MKRNYAENKCCCKLIIDIFRCKKIEIPSKIVQVMICLLKLSKMLDNDRGKNGQKKASIIVPELGY